MSRVRQLTPRYIIAIALRILIAATFAVSAVAKLVAIDDFELYIFSYGWLPLDVCFVAARLCIGAELALCFATAVGFWPRTTWLCSVALMLAFTLFLCYASLVGRDDSCQCFGRLADMPPTVSMLKNSLLLAVILLYYRLRSTAPKSSKIAKYIVLGILVLLMALPFVVSVPDSWAFGPEQSRYNEAELQATLAERHLDHGRYVVAFVTPGCPYCRMTRSKLASIANRHHLDSEHIVYIEPEDIGSQQFLEITYGQRPLVLLVDDGTPKTTYHYRNINERQISNFLAHK